MTSLRTIVLACVLSTACNPDAPAPTEAAPAEAAPAKAPGSMTHERLPHDDPHALPPPGEKEPPPPIPASAKGTFDATIDGKPAHFMRLPRGQNRAVAVPDEGVARVSLAASGDDSGLPHLRLLIDGVRPDQVQYPLTITGRPKDAGGTQSAKEGPSLTIRYQINDKRLYVIDPAKDANVEVTLEGFQGSTLRGRFTGKLAPTAAGLGAPIPISGKFAVELVLQGVQPGLAGAAEPAGDAAPTGAAAAPKSP
jgi:hypothetical protein